MTHSFSSEHLLTCWSILKY